MYPDRHYVNKITGELKLISSPEEFTTRFYTEPGWEIITAEEYSLFCQVAIYAIKSAIN